MNKEEQMLAISKLIFELTIANNITCDLDVLLERLFSALQHCCDLPLEPRGAILLINPRGYYLQVAQFGMAPALASRTRWESDALSSPVVADRCQIQNIALTSDSGETLSTVPARALLLPLNNEVQGLGYAVLFVALTCEISATQMEFIETLAKTLSGIVQRVLTSETLRIRELELEEARADALRKLGVASEYRDNETGWHIMRMSNYAVAIAKKLGLSEDQRELLYAAAPMHDVGKIGIADALLLKPGKLTEKEFEVMKTHTEIGVTILEGNDELISAARAIAGSHHERWNGTGYPKGLKEDEIPLLARVCAVADVFDALTSKRPYKQPWAVRAAHGWIMAESGKYFDPAVTQAFDKAFPEILRIRELYRDEIIDPKQELTLPPVKPHENCWIPWDNSLSVGIGVIDEHHRYLFDLINDLYAVIDRKRGAREVARVIKALDAYAKIHFRAEEQMMAHYGFKGIHRQIEQHHAFERKIAEFYEELHTNPLVAQFDVFFYLYSWLINHIRFEDAQLAILAKNKIN